MTETYRAVVTRVDSAGGVWVQVPALGADLEFGPCDVATDAALMSAGERVLVGTVTGTLEDVVIFGALDADTANMQWFYSPGVGAPAVGVGNNNDWAIDDAGQTYEKVAGVWVAKANIRGATGPTGPTGASGTAIYYGDVNLFPNPLFETVGNATNHDDQVSGWTAFWRGLGTWLSANQSGFETDVSAWTSVGGGTVSPISSSTTRAHAGTKSMLIAWNGTGGVPYARSTVTQLVIGKQYTFTAWLWNASGAGPDVKIGVEGISNGVAVTTRDAWVKASYTFTATATSHNLVVAAATAATAGNTWVDDLALVPVRDSEVITVADPANVYSGTRSLRVTLPGEALAGASNSFDQNNVFPVTAGEIITARIKLKTTSGAPTFISRLVCAPPGGSPDFFGSGAVWTNGPTWTPTSTWTEYVCTFVVPSGCTQARLIPIFGKNDAPSATDSIMWADEGAIYREAAANVGNSLAPKIRTFLSRLRITGGGIRTALYGSSTGTVSWSMPFRIQSIGRDSGTFSDGYLDITMPTNGSTITGHGGIANQTVTASGVPLPTNTSLWYEHPLGGNHTSLGSGNFHIVGNLVDFEVPSNWIHICTFDSSQIEGFAWGDGKSESGWHYVGGTGEPAFQNSWVNFDARTARFCRRNGITHLGGIVKSGTLSTVIFNLPAGYRPAPRVNFDLNFPIASNNAYGTLSVNGNGDVILGAGSNAWVDFVNVHFPAEA